MKILVHKIYVALKMIAVYKNWPRVFAYRLNLLPQPMTVKLRDGSKFKVRDRQEELSDAYVINESYLYGIHDKILPYLKDAKVGIDVGAHIGAFSVFAAKRSAAKIFAIEPAPANIRILNENIALNEMEERIIPLQLALAGKSGTSKLFVPQNGGLATTTRNHISLYGADRGGPVKVLEVKALSLADFFFENKIKFCDFIKMDCEGGEYDILYNTAEEIFAKIGVMSIECHQDGNVNELMKFLRNRGFEVVRPTEEFGEIFCANISFSA